MKQVMTGIEHRPLPEAGGRVWLEKASRFTIEELTTAYNRARADYLVPMPMTADRLAGYIEMYDIDLDHSRAAVDGNEIIGLAMLGVRAERTWITRLGVLPGRRQTGAGEALTRALLDETRALGRSEAVLEVIEGNRPAHNLFLKLGFHDTRGLLVLRREPGPPAETPPESRVVWFEQDEALDRLKRHPIRQAWTNESETYANVGGAEGLEVDLKRGGRGWMIYRRQEGLLSHFVLYTERGSAGLAAAALAAHLYDRFPHSETQAENLPADDPHYPGLRRMGFTEVFRRTEMAWRG